MKPVLAFTMGDPAGIGPEIAVAAAKDARVRRACRPLLVGTEAVFKRFGWRSGVAPIFDPGLAFSCAPGRPTVEGGRASFGAFEAAVRLAARRLVAGVVSGPISKDSWSRAGIEHRDHTEYLRRELDAPGGGMLLMAGELRAILATRHVSLREALRDLDARAIEDAARAADRALRELGIAAPRLALCALNPHAGEGGLLGEDEARLLAPALAGLRKSGLRIEGPIAADAAWSAHRRGRYDGLVALYHDQAMIPLKLWRPFGVVNWTAGLPIVRTSAGHGTAFDIAGRGAADPSAAIDAALLAARLASRRDS
ncbi:MAG: 4-hydroxythreonine-4-phosphate dehydrogenase PdxA [Elusimicrobia bacterium]|nr:4-hydroxythreonine-4-phosphate dehydrogenase PdxA [Elusimicrobiota bacterium]